MYRDSPSWFYMEDYCKVVESCINFMLSNPNNISEGRITCLYEKCKNKKFHQSDDIVMQLLKKEFIEKYMCWFPHEEHYAPYEIMLERIVGSTSSSSNIYRVVDDNDNHYKIMVIYAIEMNHSYLDEDSCVDKKPNIDATMFFFFTFKRF